jgi:tetratricopeptide (TPR) repeat protein
VHAGYYYIDPRPSCRLVFPTKPIGLRRDDLADPEDVWIIDQDEPGLSLAGEREEPKKMWINAFTGQESYLSLDENAVILQRCVRNHLAAALGSPTLGEMIRAIKFQREAAERFAEFPDKLSACVNYALLCHTHEFDFDTARMLYKDALVMSPENPVLLRSYALFRMMECEVPRGEVWNKCSEMFRAAFLRDPKADKFQMCEDSFFHFSVIQQPTHRLALLNFALVNQCIHEKFELADRLYRMALRYAPSDKLVNRNYSDFLEQQLPGGEYFRENIGPNGTIEQRSKVVEEMAEWGEWCVKMDKDARDARFAKFWYNRLTSKTRWVEPDWDQVWKNRVKRSTEVRQLGNYKEWWDDKLGAMFYQDIEYEAAKLREEGTASGSASTSRRCRRPERKSSLGRGRSPHGRSLPGTCCLRVSRSRRGNTE